LTGSSNERVSASEKKLRFGAHYYCMTSPPQDQI